jgi:hypothetical protein
VKRDGIGDQAAVASRDQQSQPVCADQRMLRAEILFAKMWRLIHGPEPFAIVILSTS